MKDLTVEQKLQIPFPPNDIEWRAQSSGFKDGKAWAMIMPYVTNRANQERLDEVFGVFGWENQYREVLRKDKISFLCGITVYKTEIVKDGFREGVTKWDGADETNFENFKGGLSGSMKRASVQLGIGRYLYKLDSYFAELSDDRKGYDFSVSIKKKKEDKFGVRYFFNAPKLPAFALPENFVYEIKKKEGNQTKLGKGNNDKMEKALKDMGAVSITDQASECMTQDELKAWWLGLTKAERQVSEGVKDNRKSEIDQGTESVTSLLSKKSSEGTDKYNKYTFEELKAMKLPELHGVCKSFDLMGYTKKSKADIINLILKHINK